VPCFVSENVRPEPIMLQYLPVILSRIFQIIQLLFPKLFPFLSYYSEKWFIILQFAAHVHTNVIERQTQFGEAGQKSAGQQWGSSDRLSSLRYSNQIVPIIPTLCSWRAHHSSIILFQKSIISTVHILCSCSLCKQEMVSSAY